MARIDARVHELERRTQPPGRIVVVYLDQLGQVEAALKLAEAEREAGPGGTVIRVTYDQT